MSDGIRYMKRAIELARPGLGKVWPNPSVGCVIVKHGAIIAEARTGDGGRPHAEYLALKQAASEAKGATCYVSLEPCSHVGQTSPCTDALIEAGVARVLVAVCDPDPRVNGRGITRLRQAGIEVEIGLLSARAAQLNGGFFRRIHTGTPIVHSALQCPSEERSYYDAHMGHLEALVSEAQATPPPSVRLVLTPNPDKLDHEQLQHLANHGATWLLVPHHVKAVPEGIETLVVIADEHGRPDRQAVLKALGARGLTRVLAMGEAASWATDDI